MTQLSLKYLKYLFGENIPDDILYSLKFDYISRYSITPANLAYEVTEKIKLISEKILKTDISNLIITEMTACIGGNVISFSKYFKHVNAIELCLKRFNYLNNNIKIFGLGENITTINGNSIIEVQKLKQDIIFFDIPWGGKNYKFKEKMDLYISKIPSYTACDLVKKFSKIIVMKIPNNFNIIKFKKKVKMKIINIFELNKFKLIILI